MHSLKTLPLLLFLAATLTTTLALHCAPPQSCSPDLIPSDCLTAINSTQTYTANSTVRHRTCVISYTCPTPTPITSTSIRAYYDEVVRECGISCGNVEPEQCPGGRVEFTHKPGLSPDGESSVEIQDFGNGNANDTDADVDAELDAELNAEYDADLDAEYDHDTPPNTSPNAPNLLTRRWMCSSHTDCHGSTICNWSLIWFTPFKRHCKRAFENNFSADTLYSVPHDFSHGRCLMKLECDPAVELGGGRDCEVKIKGSVVKEACERVWNQCGEHCGQRRVLMDNLCVACRIDYRAHG